MAWSAARVYAASRVLDEHPLAGAPARSAPSTAALNARTALESAQRCSVKKLASLAVLLAALAGCPDQIEEGRNMMRGASDQERKNVDGQAKSAGAIE